MVLVNNNKAIEITKDKIREYRDAKLKELDIEFQRALENGSDTTEIVNQKQYYRDMPTQADNKTNEELLSIIGSLND